MEFPAKERLSILFGRRSIRAFKPGPMPASTIKTLLEAAMAAPSAAGKDPWRFIVIRQEKTLNRMADVLAHGQMLRTAVLGILVCGDQTVAHDHLLSYLLQDCSAAIENLLIAAHALDLGACWLGVHPREDRMQALSTLFQLPAGVLPVSAIAIGHPAEHKEARTRYEPAYVHYETWDGKA
jgi:nitroreductase